MCGRFSLNVDPTELQKMIPHLVVDKDVVKRFNVAPTQQIATVLNKPERAGRRPRLPVIILLHSA